MASNLYQLGVPLEVATLILRNSPEVVTAHYIKFEKEGKKVEATALLTQAFVSSACAVSQETPDKTALQADLIVYLL
jgi:hypothetical protein